MHEKNRPDTIINTNLLNVMRPAQAAQHLGIARSTFWRWVATGIIPRGTRLTSRCTVWKREVLDEFIEQRKNAGE